MSPYVHTLEITSHNAEHSILKEEGYTVQFTIVINWVKFVVSQVVVWGHSLGSAICAHTVAEFDLETGGSSTVTGVVLEAPFNNIKDEILSFR